MFSIQTAINLPVPAPWVTEGLNLTPAFVGRSVRLSEEAPRPSELSRSQHILVPTARLSRIRPLWKELLEPQLFGSPVWGGPFPFIFSLRDHLPTNTPAAGVSAGETANDVRVESEKENSRELDKHKDYKCDEHE